MTAISNLVHQQTTTTGTGPYTLTSVNGRQPFDTAFGHGATTNVFYVFMMNQAAAEYMWAKAHLSAANTLVIDTVLGGSSGTSAVSFSAGTIDVTNALPADYVVPLDGAPTWTGKHTFGAGVLHSSSSFADTFVGSGLGAYFWENMNVTASHASKPEIGAQFNVSSNVGISNVVTITIASPAVITLNDHPFKAGHAIVFNTTGALPTGITGGTTYYVSSAGLTANSFQIADTSAHAIAGTNSINTSGTQSGTQVVDTRAYSYKIGVFASCLGDTNSASVYGINSVTQGHAGPGGYLVTGIESDINNIGADAPTIGSDTSAYGVVAVGAGNFKSTAGFWSIGTTAGGWHFGYAASGNVSDSAFIDISSAAISFNGANGILVGTVAKARQSQIHGYVAANSLQIIGRIENDNGGSGVAAIGFQATNSAGETRSAKAGIGLTRAAANGRGKLALYNRIVNDTSDFTTSDEVMSFDSSNNLQFTTSAAFAANGTVATSLGSLGPTGSHTTVQTWLKFIDSTGTTRYVPCF